jgi:hypothetical protein
MIHGSRSIINYQCRVLVRWSIQMNLVFVKVLPFSFFFMAPAKNIGITKNIGIITV